MDFFENDLRFNKIIFRDRFYYPPEINAAIHDMVAYLRGAMVSDTPFIYLFARNHVKTVVAFFAIIRSGHVCVLVDPDIGRLELAEMKQDTPPCALVHIDPATDTFDYNTEITFTKDNPQEFDREQLDDVAIIMYTNAEDGYAKGAMLTRQNLLANADVICSDNHISRDSLSFAILPFSHIFGFQYGVLTPLRGQSGTLIEEPTSLLTSQRLGSCIIANNVSHLYSIPLFYYLLSKSRHNFSQQIFSAISGGYKLSTHIRELFFRNTGVVISEGYGLTESSGGCVWQKPGEFFPEKSIGRPIHSCQVKIGTDDNTSPFQEGEILLKGDIIMKGYYRPNVAPAGVTENGWFKTGDIGQQDAQGNIYFCGTKKNMFNIAGRKVYRNEIHRYFLKNTNVVHADFALEQNDLFGDQFSAHLVLKENTNAKRLELRAWLNHEISCYKIPKMITFSA